jgi:hypothetical protein
MASKKRRQTFEKMKREQAVKERRERKQERKRAARLERTVDGMAPESEGTAQTVAHAHGG